MHTLDTANKPLVYLRYRHTSYCWRQSHFFPQQVFAKTELLMFILCFSLVCSSPPSVRQVWESGQRQQRMPQVCGRTAHNHHHLNDNNCVFIGFVCFPKKPEDEFIYFYPSASEICDTAAAALLTISQSQETWRNKHFKHLTRNNTKQNNFAKFPKMFVDNLPKRCDLVKDQT